MLIIKGTKRRPQPKFVPELIEIRRIVAASSVLGYGELTEFSAELNAQENLGGFFGETDRTMILKQFRETRCCEDSRALELHLSQEQRLLSKSVFLNSVGLNFSPVFTLTFTFFFL